MAGVLAQPAYDRDLADGLDRLLGLWPVGHLDGQGEHERPGPRRTDRKRDLHGRCGILGDRHAERRDGHLDHNRAGAGTDWVSIVYAGSPGSFAGSISPPLGVNVAPVPLQISVNNASKAYGAALPSWSLSYSGFVNGDTPASLTTLPSVATSATAASSVGSYPSTAGRAVDPNYTISYVGGTLTVTPVVLTIAANNASKLYGAALPAFSATYTGLVNGDTPSSLPTPPTFGTNVTAASGVGSYSISVGGAVDLNYTISYAGATLTVNPAPLTITANAEGKPYGSTLSLGTTAFSTSTLYNGDTVTGMTLASSGAAATATVSGSPYAITPSAAAGTGLSNYSITYVNGNLTVNPAPLTITAGPQSKTYGAA